MSTLDKWIDNKIVQNVIAWGFMFLILLPSIQGVNPVEVFFIIISLMPPVYINNLIILPYFSKNKKLLGVFLFSFNVLFFSLIYVYYISDFFENFEWKMLYNLFGVIIFILLFSSAIKIARDSFLRRQQIKEAELKLLKAQLNPHFLFNTLNNLYGLSVIKSDKLPELMLKLSDLLRYSLYDTKEVVVALDKELHYLKNYVSLEQIRLEEETNIHFHINGEAASLKIAPMLLIVFVENAFKHLGTSKNGKSDVTIDINIIENRLEFRCINTIENGIEQRAIESGKSGIGLKNAKKRLVLIYPEKHQLAIEQNTEEYIVRLNLYTNETITMPRR